jgi:hypothetical protein
MMEFRHEIYTAQQSPSFSLNRGLGPESLDDYTALQDNVSSRLPDGLRHLFVPRTKDIGITSLEAGRIRTLQEVVPQLQHFPIDTVANYIVKQLPGSIERPLDVNPTSLHAVRTHRGIQIVAEVSDPDDTALKEREAAARGLERLIEQRVRRKDRPPLITLGRIALPTEKQQGIRIGGLLSNVQPPASLHLQPMSGILFDLPQPKR